MNRYTVIGARGYIGSHIAGALSAEGMQVYLPARDDPQLFERELGRVFYCAGLTGDYRTRPFDAVEAHVSLISKLLSRGRFERIVYLSSTRLYDVLDDGEGLESRGLSLDPNDPEHLYELSKALGENLTVTQSGGRGVVARLSYVFGWDDHAVGFLSDWLRRARKRGPITIDSSPTANRDYIHVDDVAWALRRVLDSDLDGIVNVASGESVSNAELAETFTAAGRPVSFTRAAERQSQVPCDVSRLAAIGVRAREVRPLIARQLSAWDAGKA